MSELACLPTQAQLTIYFLVHGASSSVGLFAVSLAKAMGYKVIGVCSENCFDLVKSHGAKEVASYRAGEDKCAEDIKRITGGGVLLGLDTISEYESTKIVLGGFKKGGDEHKQLNLILPPKEEDHKIRLDVKLVLTMMLTLFGIGFNLTPVGPKPTNIPAPKSHRDFHVEICRRTPELITKYGIKPNSITMRGGLDDVFSGCEDMMKQKVSGTKLVYKVA